MCKPECPNFLTRDMSSLGLIKGCFEITWANTYINWITDEKTVSDSEISVNKVKKKVKDFFIKRWEIINLIYCYCLWI